MRILYLYQYFSTREGSGLTRAYEFATRLVAEGHEVTVVTSPGQLPAPYKEISQTTTISMDGIQVIAIPVPYSNKMSFTRRIRSFGAYAYHATLLSLRTPADVIYASSSPLTICIPGILGSLWRRVPMVFEVRDLWPELPIAMGALKNPIARWLARAMEWSAYHRAKHIVALSPGMKEGIMRRGIPAEKVTVIPNSSDIDLFALPEGSGQPLRERLGLSTEQPLLVYAGTFGLANNVGYIVEIAKEMQSLDSDVHFLLIGAGMQFDEVKAKAESTGVLGKNLTILSSIPKKEMPQVYSAATVILGILAPIKEMWPSSPNKIFDAFAAGRPIAVNYRGWIADMCESEGVGVFVPETDAREAALRLQGFVRDSEALSRARRSASRLAHEEFSREKMAARLVQVLQAAIDEK